MSDVLLIKIKKISNELPCELTNYSFQVNMEFRKKSKMQDLFIQP